MFIKKYEFPVKRSLVVDFVRLLGRYGLRFTMGDEYCVVDHNYPQNSCKYRKFKVYTTKWKMVKFNQEAMSVLANDGLS